MKSGEVMVAAAGRSTHSGKEKGDCWVGYDSDREPRDWGCVVLPNITEREVVDPHIVMSIHKKLGIAKCAPPTPQENHLWPPLLFIPLLHQIG